MKKFTLVALLFLFLINTKAQTFNPQLASMLQDTLDTYVSAISNIKGMSASVYIPGQGIWQGTSGVSHSGQPITKEMEFGIASNSKLFVSTMMLMLQEDGILSLEDSVHEWLPNYTNVNPDITIRQLLNHTSGVSDPIFASPWMDTIMTNPTRVFTPNEVLSWLGAPLFAPGTGWNYSNVNYILAGMIAQSATGFSISQLIRDSILDPLNMDSTFYDVEEPERGIISHRWYNSIDYNDTSRVGLNSAGGCAGSIFSTSSEMAQWYHALFSGQIISASSLAELSTFVATSNPDYDYGLGLDRSTTLGTDYWGHGGSTWGYRSKMIYDTCMGTVICGLTNSWPSGMEGVTFLLYRVVLNHVPQCAEALNGINTVCQGTNGIVYTVPPITNATSYTWTLPSGAIGTSNTNSITVDYGLSAASGFITVSGVNNFGAGGNSSLWVNVNPKPATPLITESLNVLTSSSPVGNQWYNSNGMIAGATNQTYTATASGDYYVIVTLAGCSSDSSNVLNVIITGIEDSNPELKILMYPNPASDQLIIEIDKSIGLTTFEISTVTGQVIWTGNLISQTIIPTSEFTPGIYMVKFENNKSREYKKVIFR
ncbi:MAG: serine hydrolase [Bacteroidetes bacterium]|nr:serine hydrolase [Bacteroidota bacterium]